MTADLVNMAMNDFARRFGNWLGIEPDDADADAAALAPSNARSHVVVHSGAPAAEVEVEAERRPEPARATTVVVDHEVVELRRLVSDLRAGLHDA